ncbi:MAG: LacI family DNA-binding transcriptional regulator [Anaerolineales bacterium]|nr:LacI family DNA-binding transcriptional regulator [Anaerolineales bacterium]
MKKKITIRDVAAVAGVSHQTVSRVLNYKPDVSQETRQHVLQVIEELEYQPSAIARSLAQQRSYTLGVVTAGLCYIGPSRTLNGITEQAEHNGYALLLKELPKFGSNDLQPIIKSLFAHRIDGIIWAVPEVGDNRAWFEARHAELSVPMIFTTMQSRENLPSVAIDNYAGGRMATEHLMRQGRRRIGHIAGPLDWWEARQRKAAWRDSLRSANLPDGDDHVQEGNWSSAGGYEAFDRLLEKYPDMDAVFVANDQMALSVLQIACMKGIRIPDDLAVVGFDGLPESLHYWPPLTTVYQDQAQLGRIAVQQLVQMIEVGQDSTVNAKPKPIMMQPELIVRASSGYLGH